MNRTEFVIYTSVNHSNPNGDPDNGNAPRVDTNGYGIVTDASFKRKIRDNIMIQRPDEPGCNIFIRSGATLNDGIAEAVKKATKEGAVEYLCKNYFDIRAFGAVLATGDLKGRIDAQVRGPVQVTFGKSLYPVEVMHHTLTRLVATEGDKERTMGGKSTVPHAIYAQIAFINPFFAEKTNFSDEDTERFVYALKSLYENSRSAARPDMEIIRLYQVTHDNQLGNCSTAFVKKLFKPSLADGVVIPASDDDYVWNDHGLDEGESMVHTKGMTITRLV